MRLDADVIVIGAGLSGLVAARRLAEADMRVIVLEARDRVGGRLHTGRVGGQVVDLGGHLMTATQDRLAALADELGVESQIPDRSGKQRFPRGGILAAFAQWRAVRRVERLLENLERAEMGTDPISQSGTSRSSELDRQTLGQHLETIRNSVARARLALHAELIFAADPADLSLLAYLDRMAVTGGFAPRGELPGGGRERYFPAGAQELAVRLARDLDVRLSANVVEITQREDLVDVVVNAGGECNEMPGGGFAERPLMKTFSAARVVLAVPPAVVRHIRVELPATARAYVDGASTGGVVKVFVAYERAFWRDAGLSGEAYRPQGSTAPRIDELGAVRAVIANGNLLVAFVVGREAARWATRDAGERRREVIDTLVAEFGEAARDVRDYLEADWAADPWSAGCVVSTRVGVLSRGAAWGEAFGRVHVAGTEAARGWTGYMDGAIEAGERAAREVVANAVNASRVRPSSR